MNITEERIKTNLLMLDYFDMWDEFHFKSINDVKTMRYYNLISNLINSQIDASISWIDSKEAEEFFTGESAYQTEAFQTLEKEWDNILESKYPSVEALLSEVYRRGKAQGYTDMREHIKYTEADKQALKIARNYNYHLIRKLDKDTRNQIKNKITEAVITGEHPNKLAPKLLNIAEERLHGSTFSPKQRATMIARTEISRVQNTGILQSYINEGYTEVKILTAEDNNVCTTCLKYAFDFNKDEKITFENRGKERVHNIIKLIKGEQFPPFHPLCRCTYVSIWKSKIEPPKKPYIINLTPYKKIDENILSGFFGTICPRKPIGQEVNLSDKELEKMFSEIVDSKDMNMVKSLFYLFKNELPTSFHEWGAVSFSENEKYGFGDKTINVTIPLWIKQIGEVSSIPLMIHNHLTGGSALPSEKDLLVYAKYGVKYGITTNELGTTIVKNNKIKENKQKYKEIRDDILDIMSDVIDDFSEDVRDISFKDIENLSIQDKIDLNTYVVGHTDKYESFYQEKLNKYGIKVTFINDKK